MRHTAAQKSFAPRITCKSVAAGTFKNSPYNKTVVTGFLLASLPAEIVFDKPCRAELEASAQQTRRALFEAVTGKRLSAHRLRPGTQKIETRDILKDLRAPLHQRGWDGGMPPSAA
jgi:hypothetical protein